jgi:hypothetical protein
MTRSHHCPRGPPFCKVNLTANSVTLAFHPSLRYCSWVELIVVVRSGSLKSTVPCSRGRAVSAEATGPGGKAGINDNDKEGAVERRCRGLTHVRPSLFAASIVPSTTRPRLPASALFTRATGASMPRCFLTRPFEMFRPACMEFAPRSWQKNRA